MAAALYSIVRRRSDTTDLSRVSDAIAHMALYELVLYGIPYQFHVLVDIIQVRSIVLNYS